MPRETKRTMTFINNKRITLFQRVLGLLGMLYLLSATQGARSAEPVVFEDLKPVFKKHCNTCHNSERPRGGLDLSSKASILAGSDSGQSVVGGKPAESLLFKLTAHLEAPHMPPNSPKIPEKEVEKIRTWIALGLPERKDLKNGLAAASKPADALPLKPDKTVASPSGEKPPMDKPTASRLPAVTGLAFSATLGWIRPLPAGVGENAVTYPFPEREIFSIRTAEDGNWVLVAGGEGAQGGRVTLWNQRSAIPAFEHAEETDTVLCADYLPDGGLVALGGPSKAVKVFGTAGKKELFTIRKHVDWVLDVRFSPDGLLLASSDRSGTVLISEAGTGAEVLVLRGHNGAVPAVAWSPDGNRITTAGQDGRLIVWDTHWGKQLASAQPLVGKGLTALVATRDGRIISAGRDNKIRLWSSNLEKSQIVATTDSLPISLGVRRDLKEFAVGTMAGAVSILPCSVFTIPEVAIPTSPLVVSGGRSAPGPVMPPVAQASAATNIPSITMPGRTLDTRLPSTDQVNPGSSLGKMQETLREMERACELLKDQAARTPGNRDLAEGYIHQCRAVLALKSEVLRLQKNEIPNPNPR